jgi:hypothetical protein
MEVDAPEMVSDTKLIRRGRRGECREIGEAAEIENWSGDGSEAMARWEDRRR